MVILGFRVPPACLPFSLDHLAIAVHEVSFHTWQDGAIHVRTWVQGVIVVCIVVVVVYMTCIHEMNML